MWETVLLVVVGTQAIALGIMLFSRRSKLRRAEEASDTLLEAQSRLEQIVTSVDHVFWIMETDPPRYLYISDAFEQLWGMDKQSLEKDPYAWTNIIHEDDRERAEARVQACLCGECDEYLVDYRIRTPDGELRWICAKGRAIRDDSGKVYRFSGVAYDITDRVRAQTLLSEGEERLELALWGAGLGLWDWEVPAGRVFYNVQWASILGYHLDEIQPNIHAMLALTHPDEANRVLKELQAHLDGDAPFFEAEHRMLSRDERWRWVLNRAKVVARDETGKPLRVVGTIKDIDAEKHNEQRVTGMGRVLEESLNEIYIFDAHTLEYIQANRGARENSGYDDDTLATLTPMDVYPDFTARAWRELLAPLLEQSRRQAHFTTRQRRKDGTIHPVEVYLQTSVFEGRMAAVVIAMDITRRCQAEQRLRDSEQQFRLAFEGSAAGMVLMSLDRAMLRVNPAFAQMLGYQPEELTTMCCQDITHPHDRERSASKVADVLEGRASSAVLEKRFLRRDGHVVWCLAHASLARSASGDPEYFVVQVRDITKRREAEHALKRRQAEEARFKTRLTKLIDVSNTLGEMDSLDTFYRSVINMGRSHLKFDRLGLWLLGDDGQSLRGTFGVDEQGRLRDERDSNISIAEVLAQLTPRNPYYLSEMGPLYNDRSEVVGKGTYLWSGIWRGEQLIGYISCDNLLHRQPLREKDGELLAVYASTIGHLLSRKRTEQTLRDSELRYRRMAEARSRLLSEVNHRVRNNLTSLLSLFEHPTTNDRGPAFAASLEHRIRAMAHAHNVLSQSGWQDVNLDVLLRAITDSMLRNAPATNCVVETHGPTVLLHPELVTRLAMTVFEWFVNSTKYGAHATTDGKVRIQWQTAGHNGDTTLRLRWTEIGGPPITTTPTPGTGMALVNGFIRYELGGRCEWRYPTTGADHEIEISLHPPQTITSAPLGLYEHLPEVILPHASALSL